jgi:hypothetical protein
MKFTLQVIGATALLAFGIAEQGQGRGFGGARGGGYAGARGAAYGGSRGGTYVGPRGTRVTAGSRGGVAVGPYGGVHAGGARGARVTTPSGRTYSTGSRGRATVGPYGGVRASGARGAAAVGPYGGAAVGRRGGVAVGGARGVAVGHATRYYSPATFRSRAAVVRGGYYGGYFTPGWYGVHRAAWRPARWVVPNVWFAPPWPTVSVFCGITAPPIDYDYGSNVVIENNYVYLNGDEIASAEAYAAKAEKSAARGRRVKPEEDDDWQPLGVFGLIQGEEKVAQNIFQLAVNKDRLVRGNYYNAVADENTPVYGSVNLKSQRVSWSIGKKKDIVFEAGLDNLTQEETPVLVHYGKESTQQMMLVRLEKPKDQKK